LIAPRNPGGGLEAARHLPQHLAECPELGGELVPITWFVRADDQIGDWMGSATAMLQRYGRFLEGNAQGQTRFGLAPAPVCSLPWRLQNRRTRSRLRTMERTSELLSRAGFPLKLMRNGEGWHHPSTYAMAEGLGVKIDSTAISGRAGGSGHPMDWTGAPNQPYFPRRDDLRCADRCERRWKCR